MSSRYLFEVAVSAGCALLLLMPLSAAVAATPGEINFQGLLLDSGGSVVNGLVDLDFELFDAEVGGTSLWTETQQNVSVLDGVYDLALGSVSPIGAAVLVAGSVWLEITVEGETLTPRQRLLAVPYALRASEADHASTADSAATAGNLPLGVLEAIYDDFPFDGPGPANDDPREGLADVDGDGLANFADADNDNDGRSDAEEVSDGSDINLVTPRITALPSPASDVGPVTITVSGQNFVAGQTVQINAQTPTASVNSATSFDIVVNPEPPSATQIVVTRPNGEQGSSVFNFVTSVPTIASVTPSTINVLDPVTLVVSGQNFHGPLTVLFDGVPVTATSITPTSFSIDVVGPALGGTTSVSVTLNNAQMASKSLSVKEFNLAFVTLTSYTAAQLGGLAGADARCAERATLAGLPGNYLAWVGDSTGSPSTRFTLSLAPYQLRDGVQIAANYVDLADGSLAMPLNIPAFGLTPINGSVWTNVAVGGGTLGSTSCTDWSVTTGLGRTGSSNLSDGGWSSLADSDCSTPRRLYCIEQ